ncbi:hypothetical protein VSY18_10925 [Bacillus albus]|uniref:Uncharacterized protein n=1 Tax=Bacillus thuringiensis TaxID=1428 RepID=A0A9X6TPT2_BACTU|nr:MULTISPECIES: hypothetical protein [Bacillus cereus group]KXX89297.1 hypothetical protein AT266_24620 [Bacillus cereus]PEA90148.1 hypothetical protein CON71_09240 [Bacillus thuringiensis]
MAETFRRGKIEDYIYRLKLRKDILIRQLTQNELACVRENIIGQIQSIDFILNELIKEFNIKF